MALFVLGVGILVPMLESHSKSVYQAQAQVGPTKPLLLSNLDPLPRFATSVFADGAVAHGVRKALKLPSGASVIPGTVHLTTAQDNPVMVVYGTGSSPSAAENVANTAATAFVVELNKYSGSVGTFAVQQAAAKPPHAAPKLLGGYRAVLVGLVAGLIAGCGAVGLIVVFRRPIVGAASAHSTTGLPVLGTVPLPRRGPLDRAARVALGGVSRRLLSGDTDVVYITGSEPGQAEALSKGIREFVTVPRPPRNEPNPGDAAEATSSRRRRRPPEIVELDPSSLAMWVESPAERTLTLLVIPQGIRARSLGALIDQYASGGAAALVMVTLRRHGLPFVFKRRRKAALASQPG